MGTATVLVADEECKVRCTGRGFLERRRYAVAGTGRLALGVAARFKSGLVVLDPMVPDLPGAEVARSLPAVSMLPVIMLTGRAGAAGRVAGLRLGADDYVVKPFGPLGLAAWGGRAGKRGR